MRIAFARTRCCVILNEVKVHFVQDDTTTWFVNPTYLYV
jgi:hypothetical protein